MRQAFDERRKFMYDQIQKMPYVHCPKPEGAFYEFVDLSEIIGKSYKGEEIKNAKQVAEILIADYNVAVVPCADFGYANCMRLSYAISMESIDKGLTRINDFLNTL